MPRWVATFRALYDADNEVKAQIIADQIRLNAEADLDSSEGDEIECTSVISNGIQLQPDELRVLLRKCRNALIRTQWRPAFEVAKDLDRLVYALKFNDEPSYTMGGYNYGDFMDLVESIINKGEEPDVSGD